MCKHSNAVNGSCNITNKRCPFMYWCDKRQAWRENNSMPAYCNVASQQEAPTGYYSVVNHSHGYLYVNIDNETIKLPNPYEDIPLFVKLSKTKNGEYKIKERAD